MKINQFIRTIFIVCLAITGVFTDSSHAKQKDKMNVKKEFFKAVTEGDTAKVKTLLRKDSSLASVVDEKGTSALLKAVYYGKKPIVDLLLTRGIKLNIFEASATGQTARVNELLKQDQSLLNAYSPDGFYPLGLAIFFANRETAETLLQAGADVNQVAKNGMKVAPLHSAAASKQIEIARRLLKLGANVNARQESGLTALHEVAATGQIEFAKLLLAHNADINARTDDGKTPLMFAIAASQPEMANLLREYGSPK
jgi:ankyrin repeat protein